MTVLMCAPPLRATKAQEERAKWEDVTIGSDVHKRYLLHGPRDGETAPATGWKVLVVIPGGNGSAEFAPFVGRIRERALGNDWIVVQMIAPVWNDEQAKSVVWPTKLSPWPKMKFSCEELFAAVFDDVRKHQTLDPKHLVTLSWSSGGMLGYTLGAQAKTPVTGTFVAMSVFKPDGLPNLKQAKNRRFYILHSPDDFIPVQMAETARAELAKRDAIVELASYDGGHGWRGDAFARIQTGIDWLTSDASASDPQSEGR
ncbi:MAG: alpha/beta hydrolase [Planctomycetota bacterium]